MIFEGSKVQFKKKKFLNRISYFGFQCSEVWKGKKSGKKNVFGSLRERKERKKNFHSLEASFQRS